MTDNQDDSQALSAQDLEFRRTALFTGAFVSVFNNLVKWAGLCGLGFISYLAIKEMAGQETMANIVVNFMTDIKVNQWLAYIVGGCGAGYGVAQRRTKNSTIARLSGRKEKLEQMIDPGRKSSKLTARGETRPEDIL